MSISVSAPDGVKVYTVAGGKNLPGWLSKKKQSSLKKDEDYQRRVELLQDFQFPSACQKIKVTADEQYLFATGIHAPRVRVYDVNQLSLKFERHFDSEIVDFEILSEDYSKAVFLGFDRTLDFHAKYGTHHKVRIPRVGRALAYAPSTAELYVAGSAPELWRLNLEEGRFMAPLPATAPAVNALAVSPAHGLLAAAGEEGLLECFDPRSRSATGLLDAGAAAGCEGADLTAVKFDDTGMQVVVGTSLGRAAVFDLRASRPVTVKDHQYDAPILALDWIGRGADAVSGGRRMVMSADKHAVRLWDAATGEAYTSVEPREGDINDVCVWPRSGLLFAACDCPRVQAYFVPTLGPAPRWCSFLESITEELEESAAPTVYDDYRFVSRAELDTMGLAHLVGTPLLKPYMHGFFLDRRLYAKAKAIAEPLAYETYRAQRVNEKLEQQRASRISLARKAPKVNAALAARVLERQQREDAPRTDLLGDDRFKAMFEDAEFAVDEQSNEFRTLHPNDDAQRSARLVQELFEVVGDDNEARAEAAAAVARGGEEAVRTAAPRMYEAKSVAAATAFRSGRSLADERSKPLGERAGRGAAGATAPKRRPVGDREVTFELKGKTKRNKSKAH